MKSLILFCTVFSIVYCKSLASNSAVNKFRCINMWDEGCINDQLWGAGNDDDYLGGNFNPGKRCVNMWDDGCINGQLGGGGNDDDYLNGGFNPGKRSLHDLFLKLHKSKYNN